MIADDRMGFHFYVICKFLVIVYNNVLSSQMNN